VLRHADTSVCSPEVHDPSHHPPPTLRQLSAPPHTVSIGSSGAYLSTCCAPNCRSNPIAYRVRRKHQRLPPSLLIENASERFPLPNPSVLPRRFRSRLATTRPEASYLLHNNQWRILVGRVRFARCTATSPIGIVKDSLISSECGALDSRSNKPKAVCRHVEAGQRTGNRSEGGPRAHLL
jgi:hypothetical protein